MIRCNQLVRGRHCRHGATRRAHYGCCMAHTTTVYKCTLHAKQYPKLKWVKL